MQGKIIILKLFLHLHLYLNTKHLNCKNVELYKIFSYIFWKKSTFTFFYTRWTKIIIQSS